MGRAVNLLLGALGGMLWGAACSLGLIYLYRAGHLTGFPAVLLAVSAFVVLVVWGLIRARLFMCYALPLAMLFLAGDNPATNEVIPKRTVLSIILLFVGLIALIMGAALVEMAAFVTGVCAFTCYGVIARGIAHDLDL
jgi:hypothetical protein